MTVTVNGKQRELAEGTSGAQLLAELDIPLATAVAEVNSLIVAREQFAELALQEGDVIELITIVGGG